jgi:hypothetical protein
MIAVLSIDLGERATPALRSRTAALIKTRRAGTDLRDGRHGGVIPGALQGAGNSVSVLAVSQ